MYKIFVALLRIVWILDVLNLPFMSFLDTTFPINIVAWFFIWLLIPTIETIKTKD